MSIYENQYMINSMMWISFEDNARICQLTGAYPRGGRGGEGLPPARLKQIQFALNRK